MKIINSKLPIAALCSLSVLLLSGCGIFYRVSEAPGCSRVIGMQMGGCSGVTVIRDVKIEPQINCLKKVKANNCNGGILEFSNFCEQPLIFGDLAIGGYVNSLDVIQDEKDNWIAVESNGNFAMQMVDQETQIALNGTLGDQTVTLSFTKSAPLCKRE